MDARCTGYWLTSHVSKKISSRKADQSAKPVTSATVHGRSMAIIKIE